MDLLFNSADLAKWAGFSGDYNPIHFDVDEARRVGADGVIVHGMLALLPLKQLLHDRANEDNGGGKGLRFKALLRAPVVVDQVHTVALEDKARGKIAFVIRRSPEEPEQIRGFVSRVDPDDNFKASRKDERPVSTVLSSWPAFASDFGFVKNVWLWLDSIAFATFARSHFDITDFLAADMRPSWSQGGLESCVYMQTAHEVFVHPAVCGLASSDGPYPDIGALTYSLAVELASVSERELIGTTEIALHCDDETILVSRLGLLAKPKPTNGVKNDDADN